MPLGKCPFHPYLSEINIRDSIMQETNFGKPKNLGKKIPKIKF